MNQTLEIDEQRKLLKLIDVISIICLCLGILLVASPLIGLFIPVYNARQLEDLFYFKTMVVKMCGWLMLACGIISLGSKFFFYGSKYLVETLFKNPWNFLFLFTLLWGCLSFSKVPYYDLDEAFFGWPYPFEGFLGYISYAGIYLGFSSLRNSKQKNLIVKIFIIISVIVAVFTILYEKGIMSFVLIRTGFCMPYSGTYINPNHYAYYLCVACILCASFCLTTEKKTNKLLIFLTFIINVVALCLNNTFGSYLALLVGIIFLNFMFKGKNGNLFYLIGIDLFFFVITIGLRIRMITVDLFGFFNSLFEFIFGILGGDNASAVIQNMSSKVDSGRRECWSYALRAIGDSPLFGWGPDLEIITFKFKYGFFNATHNEYLHIGVCLGIPSMVSYLSALICLIFTSFRRLKKCSSLEKCFMLGFGVYSVSAFFGITLPIAEFAFFSMLGLANSYRAKEKEIVCVNM